MSGIRVAHDNLAAAYAEFYAFERPRPDVHSFPTRRSSDLGGPGGGRPADRGDGGRGHGAREHVRGAARAPGRAPRGGAGSSNVSSEEHTSELQTPYDLVCRLLLEQKNKKHKTSNIDPQNGS